MHDTPKKELFKQDVRFHSSGCARVSDVRDLAAWLLAEQGVTREEIDRDIEAGLRTEIRLKRQVPVAWVYLTAYGDGLGRVQFREDIYGLDTPEGVALTTLDGKKKVRPKVEPQIMAAAPKRATPARATAEAKQPDPIQTARPSRNAQRRDPRTCRCRRSWCRWRSGRTLIRPSGTFSASGRRGTLFLLPLAGEGGERSETEEAAQT